MEKTFEEFVQMTAMIHATGKDYERMYAHYGIDEESWQKIAMHWMEQIGHDPELRHRFQAMMTEETERQRAAAT